MKYYDSSEVLFEWREDLHELYQNRFKPNGKKRKYTIVAYQTGLVRQIKPLEEYIHLLLKNIRVFNNGCYKVLCYIDHVHIKIPKTGLKLNEITSCVGNYIQFDAQISKYTRVNNNVDFSFKSISKVKILV